MYSESLINQYSEHFQILNIVAMLVVKLRVVVSSVNWGRKSIARVTKNKGPSRKHHLRKTVIIWVYVQQVASVS